MRFKVHLALGAYLWCSSGGLLRVNALCHNVVKGAPSWWAMRWVPADKSTQDSPPHK
jgi:hypothetical protein